MLVRYPSAWVVWRYNAWAQAFVDKVSRGSKARRHVAIVALARKPLVSLRAMLRDGTSWRDPCGRAMNSPPALARRYRSFAGTRRARSDSSTRAGSWPCAAGGCKLKDAAGRGLLAASCYEM